MYRYVYINAEPTGWVKLGRIIHTFWRLCGFSTNHPPPRPRPPGLCKVELGKKDVCDVLLLAKINQN